MAINVVSFCYVFWFFNNLLVKTMLGQNAAVITVVLLRECDRLEVMLPIEHLLST